MIQDNSLYGYGKFGEIDQGTFLVQPNAIQGSVYREAYRVLGRSCILSGWGENY